MFRWVGCWDFFAGNHGCFHMGVSAVFFSMNQHLESYVHVIFAGYN